MGKCRANLIYSNPVFLIDPVKKQNNQNTADYIDEKCQILAVVQVSECSQECYIHPEHLIDFKAPLMHMNGIDAGKQDRQIIQNIKKGNIKLKNRRYYYA